MFNALLKLACVLTALLVFILTPIGAICQDLNRELRDAEEISDPYKKANTLLTLSARFKQRGEVEKAAEILSRSLAIADRIKLPSYKAIIYVKAAEQQAQSDRAKASTEVLSRAIEIVETFKEGRYKDNFIARIANVYAVSGDRAKALQWANRISDPGKKEDVLEEVKRDRIPVSEEEEKGAEPAVVVPKEAKIIPLPTEVAEKAPRKRTDREVLPRFEEPAVEEDEEAKGEALSQYRAVWISAGGKGVTPSFSSGLRVGNIGFESGFRSSKETLGGNYGIDFLLFINPYNRFSLFVGPGVYIEDDSENEDITISVGIQTFFSEKFVVGFGYHKSRGFNGSVGIQF